MDLDVEDIEKAYNFDLKCEKTKSLNSDAIKNVRRQKLENWFNLKIQFSSLANNRLNFERKTFAFNAMKKIIGKVSRFLLAQKYFPCFNPTAEFNYRNSRESFL